MITLEAYDALVAGPYPEDQPRMNPTRFTPMQVEALRAKCDAAREAAAIDLYRRLSEPPPRGTPRFDDGEMGATCPICLEEYDEALEFALRTAAEPPPETPK